MAEWLSSVWLLHNVLAFLFMSGVLCSLVWFYVRRVHSFGFWSALGCLWTGCVHLIIPSVPYPSCLSSSWGNLHSRELVSCGSFKEVPLGVWRWLHFFFKDHTPDWQTLPGTGSFLIASELYLMYLNFWVCRSRDLRPWRGLPPATPTLCFLLLLGSDLGKSQPGF